MNRKRKPARVRASALVALCLAAGCQARWMAPPEGRPESVHRHASEWLGLDLNAPIDANTGDLGAQIDPAMVAELGVGWVRVNFVLGPWSSPEDETPHGSLGLGWTDTYRVIVDGFAAQGLQVYGAIGGEAVYSEHPVGSDEWLGDYLYNGVAIVDRFKDTVRVWESFNEPNNWVADWTPELTPRQYAKLLQELYLEVKHHNGHLEDPAWQVTLVSGPLLSHDADTAAPYLAEALWIGHNELAWDWVRSEMGTIPMDGLGYHLYVVQDETREWPIRDAIGAHLDIIEWTVWEQEGWVPPIYVSEVGWPSGATGEEGQGQALQHGLRLLRDDPRVALGTVFSLVDFPSSTYGLRYDASTPKPGWYAVQALAQE